MIYVTSNLHGSYTEFMNLLVKIQFKMNDYMFVLGDIVDYGSESMELLDDLIYRQNISCIMGEHDYTALRMLSGFDNMLKSGQMPDKDFVLEMQKWAKDGGQETLDAFRELDDDSKESVLDFLSDMSLYEEVEANGKKYLLVHAGIKDFKPDMDLELLSAEDVISEPLDLRRKYFNDVTIIVGHNPTTEENGGDGRVFYGNGSIDVDCGLQRGGRLGCLCLETGKEYYV